MKDVFKEFKPSSWAIGNRTTVYFVTILITLAGLLAYNTLPKEQFPDITIPTIYVTTIYPGTSPENMEKLVTKEIEKQCKSLKGLKKITSNSIQDFSMVKVEFNTNVNIDVAKQEVKDAVDKAKASTDFPKDLPSPPNVIDVNLSDMPILYVNISGNYDLKKLKKYADDLKDKLEALPAINKVDEVGAPDREVQINVDMNKMAAAQISFANIQSAVANENHTISGGTVKMNGQERDVEMKQEFTDINQIANLIVRSPVGGQVFLKNIAQIKDTFKDRDSYASLDGKPVITLNVIKRSSANLIDASDKVRETVTQMQKTEFPQNLHVDITGDQSDKTRSTLQDLINTIIIGFILVTLILMFFMGATNAIFVALAVPLSMFIAFLVLPILGYSMNMIVLFAFLLALGIVVDDAIVVIENTHRIYDNGKMPIAKAAKMATGEIFLPVLAGTLTTLAPFIPLAFWTGIVGEFMVFLPITLIITLLASLVVAYILNPVFAVDFMKPHKVRTKGQSKWTKRMKITVIVMAAMALIFYLLGGVGFGNFIMALLIIYLLYQFVFEKVISKFQDKVWPGFKSLYSRILAAALRHPGRLLGGTLILFVLSIVFFAMRGPKVEFFPTADPNFAYVYLQMPVGTAAATTNQVLGELENRVDSVLGINYATGKKNPAVESVITNVAIGAAPASSDDNFGTHSNLGKITVNFVQYDQRHGVSTQKYLDEIRNSVKGIPGATVTVDKEEMGPPVGQPIDIEITGDDLDTLIATSGRLKQYINAQDIGGIEELTSDFDNNKPEIVFDVNREFANRQGISSGQIGSNIRTAIFGTEISRFRDPSEDEDYPIDVRAIPSQRDNINLLQNMVITYQDMSMQGKIRQVPLSSLADIRYTTTYGGIRHLNQKRVISLTSNVLNGYNANEVVQKIETAINNYHLPEGISVKMGGAQEDQQATQSFLQVALLAAIGLIFLILMLQFNSISKTLIIISEVIFSVIGVLLGTALFRMNISIVMTGVGIVALAGIVVRNGILLVEFADLMIAQGMPVREAVMEAGRVRMTPVLLTAFATILGLIPLGIGMNIDFVSLFTHLNPHLYFGGDNAAFWGPLCWAMIFGLAFATFLTLVLVPAMYMIMWRMLPMKKFYGGKWVSFTALILPVFLILVIIYYVFRPKKEKEEEKIPEELSLETQ
jgi:multidrug efflux pump subunit AcrB